MNQMETGASLADGTRSPAIVSDVEGRNAELRAETARLKTIRRKMGRIVKKARRDIRCRVKRESKAMLDEISYQLLQAHEDEISDSVRQAVRRTSTPARKWAGVTLRIRLGALAEVVRVTSDKQYELARRRIVGYLEQHQIILETALRQSAAQDRGFGTVIHPVPDPGFQVPHDQRLDLRRSDFNYLHALQTWDMDDDRVAGTVRGFVLQIATGPSREAKKALRSAVKESLKTFTEAIPVKELLTAAQSLDLGEQREAEKFRTPAGRPG